VPNFILLLMHRLKLELSALTIQTSTDAGSLGGPDPQQRELLLSGLEFASADQA
jgi:hypothetical protein